MACAASLRRSVHGSTSASTSSTARRDASAITWRSSPTGWPRDQRPRERPFFNGLLGKSVEDLFALAQSELPPAPAVPEEEIHANVAHYIRTGEGLVRVEYGAEGEENHTLLTNFDARIAEDVIEDDGVTTTHHFGIEVVRSGAKQLVEVPAADFARLEWVPEKLGSTFIVSAGYGTKDHARAAIQTLSGQPVLRRTILHTGWRAFGAEWAYVHGGGAIGARGEMLGVRVRLPDALAQLKLPAPPTGEKRIEAVEAFLCLIGLAPRRISVPIFCAAVRPILCAVDVSLQLTGLTGTYKTEVAALVQQAFGAGFTARTLPGSWSSTGNALEVVAFAAKDAVMVVDDFVPQGNIHDTQRMHREAERLIRAQGNSAGRQRLGSDGALRGTRWPRGLIFSTGEDTPAGHSLRARMIIVEIAKGDISTVKLTECQLDARAGLYASATAAFVQWLASRRDGIEAKVRTRVAELRAQIGEESRISHRRTTDAVAQFYIGAEFYAAFAQDIGALSAEQAQEFKNSCMKALLESGTQQTEAQEAFEPASMFIRLLKSALSSGRAHLTDESGGVPEGYEREVVGWHRTGTGESTYQPRGARVGWIVKDELYLDPNSAIRAAQEMAEDTARIPLTSRALGGRMFERGYLATADRERQKFTVRKTIQGTRHDLLHPHRRLLVEKAQEAQQAHDAGSAPPDPGPVGPSGPEHRENGDQGGGEWGAA